MKNVAELARYVRFQLSQLRAQNKHHDFEHLCRHFSRLKLCDRILPATGPVGAGGDQGRDFESYQTYLADHGLGNSSFAGVGQSKRLVFACSLQNKKIKEKIRADVKTICTGPTPVDAAFYFAEADIPVGSRHELQDWAREKFSVQLEVFDGQALSEMLCSPEVFWLAEEYLGVPADYYPQPHEPESRYEKYRAHWLAEERRPENYADFFEIKYALRQATFDAKLKPELSRWIKLMEMFAPPGSESHLKRKAQYEIAVAALRGQNNLDKYKHYVDGYFVAIDRLEDPADLVDASTLLSYCSTARCAGHSARDAAQLHGWTVQLERRLKSLLKNATTSGLRCVLLELLGMSSRLPFRKGVEPNVQVDDMFRYWLRLTKEIPKAPLFPLEQFANVLTVIAPHIGDDARYSRLTQDVDKLLESRTGGFVAAEKCRDRAVSYMEADQFIPAIKQLHSARIRWFSAETIKGSVLSMLTLAHCYSKLGLDYAAAYYSLGAMIVAFRSEKESLKPLFCRAAFLAADYFFRAGASVTYLQTLTLAFHAHGAYAKAPGDLDQHDDLQRASAHCIILRALAKRFNPEIARAVDRAMAEWPVEEEWKAELQAASEDSELPYYKESAQSLLQKIQEQLTGIPFGDLGRIRRIEWSALGIYWIVTHANTYDETRIAEEFVATCQIVAADLAGVDLALLPTTVEINVELNSGDSFAIVDKPDNLKSAWEVTFPRAWLADMGHVQELREGIGAVAAAVLHGCSVLTDAQFMRKLEVSYKEGLAAKTFSVRPYAELYAEAISRAMYEKLDRGSMRPQWYGLRFAHVVPREIAWIDTPGPGYSRAKSDEFIRNRYRNAVRPIRFSLPRLLETEELRSVIVTMRGEGYRDWHILLVICNLILQHRSEVRFGANADFRTLSKEMLQEMWRDEPAEFDLPPIELLKSELVESRKKFTWLTIGKTWGLEAPRRTPDFAAFEKLLTVRYGCKTDDVAHEEIF